MASSVHPIDSNHPKPQVMNKKLCITVGLLSCLFTVIILTFACVLTIVPNSFEPKFRVESASVHPLNISTPLVGTRWDMKLTVRNPSKFLHVKYNRLAAVVYYHDVPLASAPLPAFHQGPKITVEASFSATLSYFGEERRLQDDLAMELGRGDQLNVDVMFWAQIEVERGRWPAQKFILYML